jgi:hypothetical protein
MPDQRDPARFKFAIVVGVLLFLAGALDSLTLMQGFSLLGVVGTFLAVVAAVSVWVAVRRLRRERAPRA